MVFGQERRVPRWGSTLHFFAIRLTAAFLSIIVEVELRLCSFADRLCPQPHHGYSGVVGIPGETTRMDARKIIVAFGLMLAVNACTGCVLGNRPTLIQTGTREDDITFYLDGAGNFGFGKESVPLGLRDGGYQGVFEHFIWTTYLGPGLDQGSYRFNRFRARQLAKRIQQHYDRYPGGRVNVIGLSAGSGVAIFAMEELSAGYNVDNVVMLSSSLSSEYDLTAALAHVRGGVYVLWSPKDPILRGMVPIVGTVDRASRSTPAAGVWGAMPPLNATAQTRQAYREKVHNIQWHPDAIQGPVRLQHAGSCSRDIVRELVAPIIRGTVQKSFIAAPATQPTTPAQAKPTATINNANKTPPVAKPPPGPDVPPSRKPATGNPPKGQQPLRKMNP